MKYTPQPSITIKQSPWWKLHNNGTRQFLGGMKGLYVIVRKQPGTILTKDTSFMDLEVVYLGMSIDGIGKRLNKFCIGFLRGPGKHDDNDRHSGAWSIRRWLAEKDIPHLQELDAYYYCYFDLDHLPNHQVRKLETALICDWIEHNGREIIGNA